ERECEFDERIHSFPEHGLVPGDQERVALVVRGRLRLAAAFEPNDVPDSLDQVLIGLLLWPGRLLSCGGGYGEREEQRGERKKTHWRTPTREGGSAAGQRLEGRVDCCRSRRFRLPANASERPRDGRGDRGIVDELALLQV